MHGSDAFELLAAHEVGESAICGLGLLMTKKLMDEVEYAREGIANVTIVTKCWE